MAALAGKITAQGAMTYVKVMPTRQRLGALSRAGRPIPSPMSVLALIDTGAGCSCLDRSVILGLSLSLRGVTSIHTPSTGTGYLTRNQYDAAFVLGVGQPDPLSMNLPVIESDFASEGFGALIGRDVLQCCIFNYDGPADAFSLKYRPPF